MDNPTRPVFIYALCEPGTAQVRYIGKTTRPLRQRLWDHVTPHHTRPKTRKNNWLKALRAAGQRPSITLLDIADAQSWPALERFHILAHRQAGFDLTNGTDGGEGSGANRTYPARIWAKDYDACVACNRSTVPHAAYGLCDTCYWRQRYGVRGSERTRLSSQAHTVWSPGHPGLDACRACGRADRPHCGHGLCGSCYTREYRETMRLATWKHRTYPCCQECGTTERAHAGKGLCAVCQAHLWYKNHGRQARLDARRRRRDTGTATESAP